MNQLIDSYRMILQAYNISQAEINTIVGALAELKPIAWASAFMISDLVAAAILSPIIAALMKRTHSQQQFVNQQQ